MKLRERLGKLDRLQRGVLFRVIASAVIVVGAAVLFAALYFAAQDQETYQSVLRRADQRAAQQVSGLAKEAGPIGVVQSGIDSMVLTMTRIDLERARAQAAQGEGPGSETIARLEASLQPERVAMSFAMVASVLLVIVWLGLGLSLLGVLIIGWVLGLSLAYIPGLGGIGMLLIAATPLALAFLAGMELVRLAMSGPSPILAVARNVLSEAVRMKVSVVFIVLLILLLALTPGLLNDDQPLRYRVQNWLQYGTGFAYAVLALLTLFFSTATVAFEQRDRIIWQTMVKPVRAWEYVAGKWLGVVALNAVLLVVTASGVFLFTEYLRRQPAQGEMAYLVKHDGEITRGNPDRMTEDRRLLETQVLVARVGKPPESAIILNSLPLLELEVLRELEDRQAQNSAVQDDAATRRQIAREMIDTFNQDLDAAVDGRIRALSNSDTEVVAGARLKAQVRGELLNEIERRYRTINRGGIREFIFTGIDPPSMRAAEKLTIRYKVNAGSNDPSQIYRLLFEISDQQFERQAGLDAAQQMTFDRSLVPDDGVLRVTIGNDPSNEREISFGPDGLEVLYVAGGYEANFFRIMLTMWVKLSFIAAIGVAASTFLSFPVACLVTISIVFMAESAGFLSDSLRDYTAMTTEGRDPVATVVRFIAVPVAWTFRRYAELRPTANLVEGRLVSWLGLSLSSIVLIFWTFGVLAVGWLVFRQRELALYSGK